MKQPEPLRLAEQLEMSATNADMGRRPSRTDTRRLAASELRRLHEVNQELLEALKEISSGTYDTWSEGYRAQQIAIASLAKVEKQK